MPAKYKGKVWYGPRSAAIYSQPLDSEQEAKDWIRQQPKKKGRGRRRSLVTMNDLFLYFVEP